MPTEFEFSLRIDFFRDLAGPDPSLEAGYERSLVGSVEREGARAACVPRVGEYVLPLAPHMPHPHSLITAIEHNLAGVRLADDGETERSASVVAVISAPWPGDELRDEVVRDFEGRGWSWREA
ncbi:MAG TPA: hypothetical protein VHF50_03145 [Solirubrobacterales bacterium]|nr:hypothetical protein [Solirubrobacterales bacterium]